MGKGIFTAETLQQTLGSDGVAALAQGGIDAGQAFLTGKITDARYKMTSGDTFQNLANGAATALGTAAFAKQLGESAPDTLTTLGKELATKAVSMLAEKGAALVGEYAANHAAACAAFPGKVMSYAMSYFNAYKMSVGDVVKLLTEAAEKRDAENREEQKNKKMKEFIGKMKEKMGDFNEKLNEYVSTGTSYVQMVTAYIANGPEWVTDQLDKQLSSLFEMADKMVDKQWKKDAEAYDREAKNMGDGIGASMTAKFNKELMEVQKKQLSKIEKQKGKVSAKAIAVLGKAKAKIASLTGIYIP